MDNFKEESFQIAKALTGYMQEQVDELYQQSIASLDQQDPMRRQWQQDWQDVKVQSISLGLNQITESLFDQSLFFDQEIIDQFETEMKNVQLFCQKLDEKSEKALNAMQNSRSLAKALGFSDQTMEAFYSVGRTLLDNNEYEKASHVFWFLCFLDEEIYQFWYAYGACEQELEHWEEASDAYTMAAEHNYEESPLPLMHSAYCFLKLNDSHSALNCLEKAKELADKKEDFSIYQSEVEQLLNAC